jgi:hypothetical protein
VTRPPVEQLLRTPDAYLLRGDLFALGLGRRAVDAVMAEIGRDLPGYSRPVVLVADWLSYRERFTFRGDRVRPTSGVTRGSLG